MFLKISGGIARFVTPCT